MSGHKDKILRMAWIFAAIPPRANFTPFCPSKRTFFYILHSLNPILWPSPKRWPWEFRFWPERRVAVFPGLWTMAGQAL